MSYIARYQTTTIKKENMKIMTLLIFAVLFGLSGPPASAYDQPLDKFEIEQAYQMAGISVESVAIVSAGSVSEQFIQYEFAGAIGHTEKDADPEPRQPPRIIQKCGTYLFLTFQRFWPPGFSRAGR